MKKRPRLQASALISLAAFVIVIAGMKAASSLIVPFLLALFMAIICLPLLLKLKARKVPDPLALLLVLIVVIGFWFIMVFLVGSSLADFSKSIPGYQDRMRFLIGQTYAWLVSHDILVDRSMFNEMLDPGKIMRLVSGIINGLIGILKDVFFILLMFSFLIVEAGGIPEKISAMRNFKEDSLESYTAITGMVNRYLGIKAATSLITGALIYFGLLLLGVDFPILWGVLAFVLNFVPTIGSLIAAIPAILLSLVQLGVSHALATALIFLLVNTVIGTIAEPRILGQKVGLSTIVVLLSLVFWGWVLGPVGMLLSVPLTMAAKIALAENESTRWISILLAPNKEISRLAARDGSSGPESW